MNRKYSFNDAFTSYNHDNDNDQNSISEPRTRRATISANPWMNKIKPFFNGNKNEDVPEYYNRVRYIRDSCKVFSDLFKSDKDFLNRNVDNDISKAFKEFRSSDVARAYRSPFGQYGSPSILNSTIEDLIQIHEYIDGKRKEWLENFRTISEQAKEKQSTIRQTMSEYRDNYERAVRKFESAESNLKKFQNRDRTTVPNYDERYRELEDIRTDCDQARITARDIYATETYRIASEEHSITNDFFAQYLFEEQTFYNDIQQYLSNRIPEVKHRLEDNKLAPSFHCDLSEHCLKRIQRPIAYPIETCIRLLQNSIREEGIFRIGSAHGKQKKLVAELDLQMIDEKMKLQDLGCDAHVIANTLKQYLRELPDCLLTDALLSQWNEIPSLSTDEARIQRIGQLITQLPKVNYDNLCYLIRFLNRVAEYSSENKMTATNLGICIGCSLLYPKEQLSNSYTNSSTIIELMIIHHKQFFPEDNQQDPQTSYRPQPDVIPTVFQSKNVTSSNENLLDIQSLTEVCQPSPKLSGKHRAPPPPPIARGLLVQLVPANIGETSTEQFLSDPIQAPNSSTSNVIEKDRSNSGTVLDRLPYRPKLSNYNKEQENSSSKEENELLVTSNDYHSFWFSPPNSSTSTVIEKDRSSSGIVLDRLPYRPKPSNSNKEQENSSSKEENESPLISPTSNDGVPIAKLIADLNNRTANSGQTNNIRLTSRRDNIPGSPGEITQF